MLTAFVIWMGYIVSRLSGGLAFAGILAFVIYTSETWAQGILQGLLTWFAVVVFGIGVAFLTAAFKKVLGVLKVE